MAERAGNRPFIQYGRDYSDTIARARANPPGTPTTGAPGGPQGGGGTFAPPAPAFNPADWRFAGRMGFYTNPTTGERLSPAEYNARARIPPSGSALNDPRAAELYNQYNQPAAPSEQQYTEAELAAMELANSERVAGMDPNEETAYNLARDSAGTFNQDLERSRQLTERGAGTFLDADINAYMNPFIKGALDPAAAELREQIAIDTNRAKQQAAMSGAFGGSRGTLLETETRRGGQRAIGELYGKGYAQAFESARASFEADRTAAARGAEQFRALSAQRQAQLTQDINALLTTGGLKRQLEQARLDFNFEQFQTARDWDVNNLKPLLAALATVPHSTTSTNEAKTGAMGNIIGIVATVAGAYFGGPQGAQAGASVLASQQNQGVAMPTGTGGGGGGGGTFDQAGQGPPAPEGGTFRPGLVPIGQTFYGVPISDAPRPMPA